MSGRGRVDVCTEGALKILQGDRAPLCRTSFKRHPHRGAWRASRAAGIQVAGAGRDEAEACRPAAVPVPASAPAAAATASRAPAAPAAAPAGPPPEAAAGPAAAATASPGPRVLVWGVGHGSSGIPAQWEASRLRAGVRMTDLSVDDAIQIGAEVAAAKRPGLDIAVVSLHGGQHCDSGTNVYHELMAPQGLRLL